MRLPRVVGLQAALDVILAGKLLNAKKAYKIGLVDKLVHQNILLSTSLKWAEEIIKEGKGKRKKTFKPAGLVNGILEGPLGRGVVFSKAREGVMKATHGHYPAPLKALEAVKRTYGMTDREKALRIERDLFCEAAVTDISKNLIHVFFLTEMVKKQSGVAGVAVKPDRKSVV